MSVTGSDNVSKFLRDTNIWNNGWRFINEMIVESIRKAEAERAKRTKRRTKFILKRVKRMKEDAALIRIRDEKDDAAESPWGSFISNLCPNYY